MLEPKRLALCAFLLLRPKLSSVSGILQFKKIRARVAERG
jgi:hypothetical protein